MHTEGGEISGKWWQCYASDTSVCVTLVQHKRPTFHMADMVRLKELRMFTR